MTAAAGANFLRADRAWNTASAVMREPPLSNWRAGSPALSRVQTSWDPVGDGVRAAWMTSSGLT
jgi:hypothetical protein